MKRFSAWLNEGDSEPLPRDARLKSVQMDAYSDAKGLPTLSKKDDTFWSKYINQVYEWVQGHHSTKDKAGEYLLKNRKRIPKEFLAGGTFYRGFKFYNFKNPKNDMAALLKIVRAGEIQQRNKVESWTTNLEIARKFGGEGYPDVEAGFVVSARIPSNRVVINIRDWAMARSTIELGAAATKDQFSSMLLPEMEFEVLVMGADLPFTHQNVKWAMINGKEVTSQAALSNYVNNSASDWE